MKRFNHYLTANENNELPTHLLMVDTEAKIEHRTDNSEMQTFRLGCAIYMNRQKGEWIRQTFKLNSVDDFHKLLDLFSKSKTRLYVFAHNMSYDYTILQLDSYISSRNLIITTRAIQNVFIINAERQYLDGDSVKTDYTITFASSTNYYKNSLTNLGKMIGEEKMISPDFENVSDNDLMTYCIQDTTVLSKLMEYHINFIIEHNLGNFKLTIASQAFTAFRHRFLNGEKLLIHNYNEILEMEKDSYRGGRCEAFQLTEYEGKKYKPIKDVYKLDINSMYSYVMKNNKYPLSPLSRGPLEDMSVNNLRKIIDDNFILAQCILNLNIPAIGQKSERLIFPIGKFRQTVTSPEIKYILDNPKFGEIIKVEKCVGYRQENIFSDYVDYFFNLKTNSTNSASKGVAKIFLNSLYGKFGQKAYPESTKVLPNDIMYDAMNYMFDEGKTFSMSSLDTTTMENVRYTKLGEDIYKTSPPIEEFSELSVPIIASAVTSYARQYLFELMMISGLENVYYCDTDSIFTNCCGYENLYNYIHETKLGKLKLEDFGEVEIYGLKNYKFNGELKLKGIKRDAEMISENTYLQKQFLTKALRYTKGISDGTVMINQVIKRVSNKYNKGYVDKNNGRIYPFKLDENI